MKFDTPATTNPIDQLKVVGQPARPHRGPLKTTGTAPYAYERHDVVAEPGLRLHRRRGDRQGPHRARSISPARRRARRAGDRHRRECRQARQGPVQHRASCSAGPEIEHYHQAIAVVVAETFEQARAAAAAGPRRLRARAGRVRSCRRARTARQCRQQRLGGPPETHVGDFESAFAAAPVKVDETYTTPDQAHAMMEPHATIAAWDGDRLTLWTSNQMIDWGTRAISQDAGHSAGRRCALISPFIGGGFGGKLSCGPMRCWPRSARGRPGGRSRSRCSGR